MSVAGLPLFGSAGVLPRSPAADASAAERDLVGVMFLAYRRRHAFTGTWKLTAETFASHAALALDNALVTAQAMHERRNEFERVYRALAHRLRNMLGLIPTALRSAQDSVAPSTDLRRTYEDALDYSLRAQRVVDDLERHTRSRSEPTKTRMPGAGLAAELERTVQRHIAADGAEASVRVAEALPELKVSLDRLRDAVSNFAERPARRYSGIRVCKGKPLDS